MSAPDFSMTCRRRSAEVSRLPVQIQSHLSHSLATASDDLTLKIPEYRASLLNPRTAPLQRDEHTLRLEL